MVEALEPDRRDSGTYLTSVDGLRGIAVLVVLGYHFGLPGFDGGSIGVDVFFVISGYVVANNLVRIHTTEGWFRRFWVRRISRLFPVVIVLVFAVGAAWLSAGGLGGGRWVSLLASLVMQYSVGLTFLGGAPEALLHLWSLTAEFHFYVAFPLLLMFWARKGGGGRLVEVGQAGDGEAGVDQAGVDQAGVDQAGVDQAGDGEPATVRRRGPALFLLLAAAGVMVVRPLLLVASPLEDGTVYLSSVTHSDGLLIGAAIALLPLRWFRRTAKWRLAVPALLILLASVALSPRWIEAPVLALGLIIPLAVLSTAALILGSATGTLPSAVSSLLSARPLVWAGLRSYSLYLWHYPVGVALIAGNQEGFQGVPRFAAQVLASLVIGALSYRLVEGPARRYLNYRWADRRWG